MSKVWFVTGANSGFGASIVKAALAAGDRVVATARNMEKLRSAFPDIRDDNTALVKLDVADASRAEAAVAEAVTRFGRINVLVNNAGNSYLGNFGELTNADIERQMETNFYGVVDVTGANCRARLVGPYAGAGLTRDSRGGILGPGIPSRSPMKW